MTEPTDRPGVAAFDFDGTLARRDTLVPFLARSCGWHRIGLAATAAVGQTRNRDRMKVVLVGRLFRGWPQARLDKAGQDYAATLPEVLRPELVERVRWHQSEGHAVVLVSAGLGAYLRPFAEQMGLDDVLAVELATDESGHLTGAVAGDINNRGPQKVARLEAWITARFGTNVEVELWAYGDSSGDEEMLARADHATWVGQRGKNRR